MSSSFAAQVITPPVAPPDPHKHVNYTLGMVLGVDDFTQEFAYLSGRDQEIVRDLIGYGTVCGLQVTTDTDSSGNPRVSVTPGTAVSPRGQLIRVTPTQCANLNDWLVANPPQFGSPPTSPPNDLVTLYVVLCYRECPTDNVPIPGDPCRSEDELLAPSRLTDDFKLELRYDAPNQQEEEALRDFVTWLRQIEITDGPGTFAILQDFEQAVREAVMGSPPNPLPGFPPGSPMSAASIHASDACEYLRAAFRIWTTELRPQWAQGCAGDVPDEECVLLAELIVPVSRSLTAWVVSDPSKIEKHEEHRPYLIHLRMLQEWMLCGRHEIVPSDSVVAETSYDQPSDPGRSQEYSRGDHTHGTPPTPVLSGDVTGDINNTIVQGLQTIPISPTPPTNRQVLMFTGQGENGVRFQWRPITLPTIPPVLIPSDTVVAETAYGQPTNAGASTEYSRADHTHGTPPALIPSDTVVAETAYGQPTNAGASTEYSRADHTHGTPPDPIPPHRTAADAHALNGDVTGNISSTTVVGLQNVPVASAPQPVNGQVLMVQNNQWQAANLPAPTGNFVEHPAGQPRYAIVAAGIVRGDGTNRPPVYNGPIAQATADGELTVGFTGYKQPQNKFQYIVKVLPVFNIEGLSFPGVSFVRFDPKGFVLHVTDAGTPVKQGVLARQEFMIEVSQFPF